MDKQENFDMRRIPLVIPVANTSAVNAIGSAVNTYCAVIDQLDSERYREVYKKAAEETADRGGSTWYYTCVQPLYPYPTHHIDDALIGSRIMRWMQKSNLFPFRKSKFARNFSYLP